MPRVVVETGIVGLSDKASVNLVLRDGSVAQIIEDKGARVVVIYTASEVASLGVAALKYAGVCEVMASQRKLDVPL